MDNEGFFELGLLDVKTRPARDPNTRVRFFRTSDNKVISQADHLVFPAVHRFKLPAFPQEMNLFCETTPSRFRLVNTGVFTLTDGKVLARNPIALRLPGEWTPQFVPWNMLASEFLALKDVLDASPRIRVKNGVRFDRLVRDEYDGVADKKAVLAKMALLNLCAALTATKEPSTGTATWFSFVKQIFLIDRERFIAFVDPKMAKIIRAIKDDISKFPKYKHTPADNHFEGIQAAVPEGFKVLRSKMFSIKTTEDHANMQLTIAPAKDPDGNEVVVLDADIDENGRLLAHLGDVIKHKITGGTHPIDIHEYLVLANKNIELGYDLI